MYDSPSYKAVKKTMKNSTEKCGKVIMLNQIHRELQINVF